MHQLLERRFHHRLPARQIKTMIKTQVFKRIKSAKGSATLESTFVVPIIIILLFSMISLAMYFYNKLVSLDSATYTAQQSAMNWSNSVKDLETGYLNENYSDGLYWRITNDFENSPLVIKKSTKALLFLEKVLGKQFSEISSQSNHVGYHNNVISRTVSVDMDKSMIFKDPFVSQLANNHLNNSANSEVVEPVEYIRNIELGASYLDDFISYLKPGGKKDKKDNESVTVYASLKSNVNGQRLYHYAGCKHISKIKKENLITFSSVEEAQRQGYHLCLDCAKTQKSK